MLQQCVNLLATPPSLTLALFTDVWAAPAAQHSDSTARAVLSSEPLTYTQKPTCRNSRGSGMCMRSARAAEALTALARKGMRQPNTNI